MKKEKKYYIFRLDVNKINLLVIVSCIILFIFTNFILNIDCILILNNYSIISLLLIYLLYLILHEIIHGIGYMLSKSKYNKIVYGISLEKGVLYCLCKQNISKNSILFSSILPLLLIGIFTYIIGIIYELNLLTYLSILNISGSFGDIITFNYIRKLKDIEFSEMDDIFSFSIYANYDVSKIKHYGIKYIECKDKIDRKDLNKIKISKLSIIILVVLLLISILFMFI